jgi:hypothetical protein
VEYASNVYIGRILDIEDLILKGEYEFKESVRFEESIDYGIIALQHRSMALLGVLSSWLGFC